jgi:hypothetical protein
MPLNTVLRLTYLGMGDHPFSPHLEALAFYLFDTVREMLALGDSKAAVTDERPVSKDCVGFVVSGFTFVHISHPFCRIWTQNRQRGAADLEPTESAP